MRLGFLVFSALLLGLDAGAPSIVIDGWNLIGTGDNGTRPRLWGRWANLFLNLLSSLHELLRESSTVHGGRRTVDSFRDQLGGLTVQWQGGEHLKKIIFGNRWVQVGHGGAGPDQKVLLDSLGVNGSSWYNTRRGTAQSLWVDGTGETRVRNAALGSSRHGFLGDGLLGGDCGPRTTIILDRSAGQGACQ